MPVLGQELFMVQGEDALLSFVPDVATTISGWPIIWQLRATDGGPVAVITKDNVNVGGVLVTDATYGLYDVLITRQDTLKLTLQTTPWYWEARRFDPGRNTCLARGTLIIAPFNAQP